MKRIRLDPTDRKTAILEAAIQSASVTPYNRLTREAIGARASCSPGTVSHYFGTMPKLRRAIMREAVARGIAAIVADGLAYRDPQARKASEPVLVQARALLAAR